MKSLALRCLNGGGTHPHMHAGQWQQMTVLHHFGFPLCGLSAVVRWLFILALWTWALCPALTRPHGCAYLTPTEHQIRPSRGSSDCITARLARGLGRDRGMASPNEPEPTTFNRSKSRRKSILCGLPNIALVMQRHVSGQKGCSWGWI